MPSSSAPSGAFATRTARCGIKSGTPMIHMYGLCLSGRREIVRPVDWWPGTKQPEGPWSPICPFQ
jgi:hypothetical protein